MNPQRETMTMSDLDKLTILVVSYLMWMFYVAITYNPNVCSICGRKYLLRSKFIPIGSDVCSLSCYGEWDDKHMEVTDES